MNMPDELFHGFKKVDWDTAKEVANDISDRACSSGVCHGVQIDAKGPRQPFRPLIRILCFPKMKDKVNLEGIDLKGFEVQIEERSQIHSV